ncbi:cadherin repeat domain-containing protein [Photobacterium sagamiensis]|uniref:cadherin repeat domain-containing protein n=1 Tax=Photobacterium sagamiensis TaxID=2910241 RepID=UPI003D0D0986
MRKIITTFLFILTVALVGCGGGGGSSSSPAPSQPIKAAKQSRVPLTVSDVYEVYSASETKSPSVYNRMGTLAFSLVEGEPLDVVSVDKQTGILTFINPGDARIQVVDTSSVYETSTATFRVHIEQGVNYSLSAAPKIIPAIEQTPQYIVASETKGEVTYEVTAGDAIVAVDLYSGRLTPLGPSGRATIQVSDSGNRQYKPTTKDVDVVVKAVNPDKLAYAPITREYEEGLTLDPRQLSGGDQGTFRYSLAEGFQDDGIVSVNEHTGQLTVLKAGKEGDLPTKIKVMNALDDSFTVDQREAYFDVTIKVAKRTQQIQVSNATDIFSPNKIIQPVVNYVKGNLVYAVDESDRDVIDIDPATKLPRIVGVGDASLTVTDDGNGNYQTSETTFTYSVTKAAHPGLADKTIEQAYSADPQQNKMTPAMPGQMGTISFSLEGSSDVVSFSGGVLTVNKVGSVVLTATDSGGDNYSEGSAKLTVKVNPGTHPDFTVKSINQVYQSGLCIELDTNLISGNLGDLSVLPHAGADQQVATYDKANNCIKVVKDGSTVFDVISGASENYLASTAKLLDVTITKANSTLAVAGNVRAVYSPTGTQLDSPTVTGAGGALTYSLRSGSPTDVVAVEPSTGALEIKNAGATTVVVTDAGGNGVNPGTATFSVLIDRAENPATVTYPETVYKQGQQFVPVIKNNVTSVSFSQYDEKNAPVKLLDTATGELEVKTAGNYHLSVVAGNTRNYNEHRFTVEGTVKKAPHPGLAKTLITVEYAPLKKVALQSQLPKAKGTRSYSLGDKKTKAYVKVDPNSGELTLLDYESLGKTTATILVSEAESENYLAMPPTSILSAPSVTITPPEPEHATRDAELAPTGSILESNLNGNAQFSNLKETAVHFAGVGNVLKLTDDELQKYGPGVKFFVSMQKVGETDITKRKAVMFYALRFDGCPSEVKFSTLPTLLKNKQSIAMDAPGFCEYGATNRYLTLIAIDDTLTEGNWQLASPFVIYRSSDRFFSPSSFGGIYGGGVPGVTPSQLHEWDRMEYNISK